MPGTFNIEIYRGDSSDAINFAFNGLSADVSSIQMDVRPFRGSATVTRSFSSATGEFAITDAAAATATLNSYEWTDPAGTYTHDIELTLVGGITYTILTGSFIVRQDVTNA